jgi:CRP/FNR family transcriptional regulator, cyclic AMP receptor protein
MEGKLELLKQVPLFSQCRGGGLEHIGRLVDEVEVPEGQVLMREGEYGREFFLILDGTVRIERDGRHLRDLGPGDFFGEIALLDGGTRTATATAATPARLFVLGRREFNALIDGFKDIRLGVLEALAKRVRTLEPEAS